MNQFVYSSTHGYHIRPLMPARTKLSVEFAYHIFQEVFITEIKRPGMVTALLVDSEGLQYRVTYWVDSTRKQEWLLEREIRPL